MNVIIVIIFFRVRKCEMFTYCVFLHKTRQKKQKNSQDCAMQTGIPVKRDLKHRRRRAQRTTTRSKISPYSATAQARRVVHVKFRTSKRQVCRPERTRVCIYVFTECLRQEIYFKLLK